MSRPAILLALLLPAAALAAPRVEAVRVVGRATPTGPWTDAPTEALRDDAPELAVVGLGRDGKKKVVLADPELTPLELGGRRVATVPWPDGVEARWLTVEPHAWREEGAVAPNGVETAYHSNVHMDRDRFGKWAGYDEVTYFETPRGEAAGGAAARRRAAAVEPSDPTAPDTGGLGTIRYKAEVLLPDGRTLASPGAEARDRLGILPAVHRVSIRRDDTFLGWLSSYLLVPEVFGSSGSGAGHQTDRYVGADCADVLTGALRAAGHEVQHTHVAALGKLSKVVAGPVDLDEDGNAPEPVTGIRVGDIVRIDYGGALVGHTPRSWDHVAAVWEDRSDPEGPAKGAADGRLDGFDLVVHMGHPRLVVEPLSGQCPARIDVLRWSEAKIGKRR